MFFRHFLFTFTLHVLWRSVTMALPSSTSNPTIHTKNISLPVAPNKDPWYTAPDDYEKALPGSLLRIRSAPGNFTSMIGNCSAAYNILFRTTNSYSQPAFAVTTVVIPSSNMTSSRSSLLSYQIPYNTADVNGSPSYLLYETEYPDIGTALGEGWIVSVPDFEGPLASFLLGLTEGHAVLDSVRSVLSYAPFGLSSNSTRTALWGYSGGSIASMFAIELQTQYAPELTLHGAAIGGIVPKFSATVPLANTGPQAGLLPAAFLGLTSQSPTARKLLTSSLHPENASRFLDAMNLPLAQLQTYFADEDIRSYFVNYTSFLFAPEIQAIQRDNWYLGYHGVPRIPIFIYKAINDEIAPIEEVDDLVFRWCSLGGVDIRYERNRSGGHTAEYINGVSRAREFLSSVFDGTNKLVPLNSGCFVQEVTIGTDFTPN